MRNFKIWDNIDKTFFCDDEFFVDKNHKTFTIKPNEDYILCFGTGKKDKNGIEIFESDIVRFQISKKNSEELETLELPVRFDNGTFFAVRQIEGDGMMQVFPIFTLDDVEIVGNYYENTE